MMQSASMGYRRIHGGTDHRPQRDGASAGFVGIIVYIVKDDSFISVRFGKLYIINLASCVLIACLYNLVYYQR